jgi:hypothetical protein
VLGIWPSVGGMAVGGAVMKRRVNDDACCENCPFGLEFDNTLRCHGKMPEADVSGMAVWPEVDPGHVCGGHPEFFLPEDQS